MNPREWFRIHRKKTVGYDVVCLYCGKISRAWDYRANALSAGYCHVIEEHMPEAFQRRVWSD